MIELLARWCIPERDNVTSPSVRRAYGIALRRSWASALNVLLFAGKFLAGPLSGSIAITADAFNNLSDAGFLRGDAAGLPAGGTEAGHRPPLRPRADASTSPVLRWRA